MIRQILFQRYSCLKSKQKIYNYVLEQYPKEDYESFIRNVFSLECDSDTFGAITGGVAEEFYDGFGGVDADGLLKKYLTPELWEILNM